MPNGPRIRANNVYGVISDNPLTAVSVSYNSVSLPLLPPVVSAHAVVVFDPKRVYGDPEIVVVTVHTAASTVATILRGQYGTSPRLHPQGTAWAHVPVDEDWTEILTSTTRPLDPYRGQEIFETDTNRFVARSTADVWQQDGLFFDPPACRVFHNANQSIASGTETTVLYNTEIYDTDNMHSTAANTSRITINTAGLYLVGFNGFIEDGTTAFTNTYSVIKLNGATVLSYMSGARPAGILAGPLFNMSIVYKFIAGDYVESLVYQLMSTPGARNLTTGAGHSPIFTATWIGRGN